jgi:hypothetical protein
MTGVSRLRLVAAFAALPLLLASCGGGSKSTSTQSFDQKHGYFKPTGKRVPQLFFEGCPKRPGCVARAEQIRRFPRNAVPEGYPGIRGGSNRCRSFADPFDSYWVRVGYRHTTCRVALRLMHAIFWHKTKTRSHVVGSFTPVRFPDWHCTEATGAGQCMNGSRFAYFGLQDMYRRSSVATNVQSRSGPEPPAYGQCIHAAGGRNLNGPTDNREATRVLRVGHRVPVKDAELGFLFIWSSGPRVLYLAPSRASTAAKARMRFLAWFKDTHRPGPGYAALAERKVVAEIRRDCLATKQPAS